jgi:hypothetical protein
MKLGWVIPSIVDQGSQNSVGLIDTQAINLRDDDLHNRLLSHKDKSLEEVSRSSKENNICTCVTCNKQDQNSKKSRVNNPVNADYDESSNRSSFSNDTSEKEMSSLDRSIVSTLSEDQLEYNSLDVASRLLGASTSALRYERARVCTALSTDGKGMIPYRGDGFSVSNVTPRQTLQIHE